MNSTPLQRGDIAIRWMIRRDMTEVLRIERQSFQYQWQEGDFLACLRQRNCIGMAAEKHSRITGFMIYELHKSRLKILNFAVAPEWRRQKIGTWMIDKLVNKLAQQRRDSIDLELRETNLPAQKFFQAQHFRATGIIPKHYRDSGEDAYKMEFSLYTKEEITNIPTNRTHQLQASNSNKHNN